MPFHPETKTHETDLQQLRAERHSEDRRLTTLKKQLREKMMAEQPTQFAVHTDGHVNAA